MFLLCIVFNLQYKEDLGQKLCQIHNKLQRYKKMFELQ